MADIKQIRQMAQLLAEVQDAYTAAVAEDKRRFVEDLAYVHSMKTQINEFEERMLNDYWRTPTPLRADIAEVVKASVSRARLYQIRAKIPAGDRGAETLEEQ